MVNPSMRQEDQRDKNTQFLSNEKLFGGEGRGGVEMKQNKIRNIFEHNDQIFSSCANTLSTIIFQFCFVRKITDTEKINSNARKNETNI